ncbi:MAG TPA: adenylate/guanylate cyclase domain-containing protein [Solirubrobacterales bacterium]|nr:adenylate/guanylate cyclase domain-containing protein [Solirubrobacterales bacterium]
MTEGSETRYALSGGLSIAYRTFGEGPPDLIVAPGFVSHVEEIMRSRHLSRAPRAIAGFARLILFDKREQGLSDRTGRPPTIEETADDLLAVLDAAGSERAAVLGISEGGPMAIMLAATHPERCTHLILWGSWARLIRAPGYPEGVSTRALDAWGDSLERGWGSPVAIEQFAPSWVGDREAEEDWARLLRLGTSPRGVKALLGLYRETDVRDVLPLVTAPTMVMHPRDDAVAPVALGRHLAEKIPGARWVEIDGADHVISAADVDLVVGQIEEFLIGHRAPRAPERVLATVLFTDIVDSTVRAAELGDRGWRELLDRHDVLIRRQIQLHRGSAVKSTGDGILATFDGPARAIGCATAAAREVRSLGIEIRAGLHSGECELRDGDVGGMAVHIGARVAARAGAGEVLVSRTVKDLVVGSGIEFEARGTAELKGVPGEWALYAVSG